MRRTSRSPPPIGQQVPSDHSSRRFRVTLQPGKPGAVSKARSRVREHLPDRGGEVVLFTKEHPLYMCCCLLVFAPCRYRKRGLRIASTHSVTR